MIEVAVVLGETGPLYWHLPPGRTAGSIPDSRELWEVIWENRKRIKGIAHSHPGSGPTSPSHTDITTFMAIERALGRGLEWWITSSTHLYVWTRADDKPPLDEAYTRRPILDHLPWWTIPLRRLSLGLTIEEVFGIRLGR